MDACMAPPIDSAEHDRTRTQMIRVVEETARMCRRSGVSLSQAIAVLERAYMDEVREPGGAAPLGIENQAAQILSAWHEVGQYLHPDGRPRPLTTGESSEFARLCSSACPGSDPTKILATLVNSGAVRVEKGNVRPLRRRVMVPSGTAEGDERVTRLVHGYLRTLTDNTSHDLHAPRRFERTVATTSLDPKQLPALAAYLTLHGQAFLEDLDAWITAREVESGGRAVGVGLYLFSEGATY